MKIYLAWDTQEIFIVICGQLVLYGVSKSLFKYIDEYFEDFKDEVNAVISKIEGDFMEVASRNFTCDVTYIVMSVTAETIKNQLTIKH